MWLMLAMTKLFLASSWATKFVISWLDVDKHPFAFLGFQENDCSLAGAALLQVFRIGSGIK